MVLVTGAGGSIGSELCRQIARANPRKLLLLDKSENSLFYVNLEIANTLTRIASKPFLMDLLNADRVKEIVRGELGTSLDIIFHAAAYKHVGLLELHPQEAIRNNVLGTRNIAEAAIACGYPLCQHLHRQSSESAQLHGTFQNITELCVQACSTTDAFLERPFRQRGRKHGERFTALLGPDSEGRAHPGYGSSRRSVLHVRAGSRAFDSAGRGPRQGWRNVRFRYGRTGEYLRTGADDDAFLGTRPDGDLSIEFTGLKKEKKSTRNCGKAGSTRWRPNPSESS